MSTYNVSEGSTVYSVDGEKLGKVVRCGEGGFAIEKGFFFPKEYYARFADVLAASDGKVVLRNRADELHSLGDESIVAARDATVAPAGAVQETRLPLAEEELTAEVHPQEVGEVRVQKEVVTEQKHITVPVTREEVRVERVPIGAAPAAPGEATFEETEITVPVVEEQIEVHKRPVVREEVRVQKTARTDEEVASGTVRKEHARIESEGSVERAP